MLHKLSLPSLFYPEFKEKREPMARRRTLPGLVIISWATCLPDLYRYIPASTDSQPNNQHVHVAVLPV